MMTSPVGCAVPARDANRRRQNNRPAGGIVDTQPWPSAVTRRRRCYGLKPEPTPLGGSFERARGFDVVSHKLVGRLLAGLGFSLQANRKTREGSHHPDRDAQFEHINARIKAFQAKKQPAISVDTKKKELVGDFKNGGQELRPKGDPEPVRVHDFKIPAPWQGSALQRLRYRRQ